MTPFLITDICRSEMSRLLCTFEDKILKVVIDTIQKENIEVATLMYDGCMIYGNYYNDCELLKKITVACESVFNGLNMKWSYKPHSTEIVMPEGWKSKKMQKMMAKVEILPSAEVVEAIKSSKVSGVMDNDDSIQVEVDSPDICIWPIPTKIARQNCPFFTIDICRWYPCFSI
jgi:hypothetical protein